MRSFHKVPYSKIAVVFFAIVAINIGALHFLPIFPSPTTESVMGGSLFYEDFTEFENLSTGYKMPGDEYIERFLRPSNTKALDKEYDYTDEEINIPEQFSTAPKVVKAYFDILSDGANMGEKKGGCGSIGLGEGPYPVAYSLLSQSLKENMHYEAFLESFEGIGHINLVRMADLAAFNEEGKIKARSFVEIETIEGSDTAGKTYFAYYYGFVTAVQQGQDGWKIDKIELRPEDFLCHAYHGWWHDARTIVEAYYIKEQGFADKILDIDENKGFTNVIASGKDGKQYRFTFARLTNGADVELRQLVMEDGKWKDIVIDLEK